MKLFNTLCLEITSDCNRKCEFCPVAYNTRPVEVMPLQWVNQAFDELCSLDYRGRIELYIYNEPLKHRDELHAVVWAAKERVPKATLMIATNGDYLKGPGDLEGLFSRGIQQIVLNAYTSKQFVSFTDWVNTIGVTNNDVYNPLPRGKRAIRVYDKSNPDEFGEGVFRLINRAGNVPTMQIVEEPMKKMCVKPFRLLNINWRGQAMVCCNDYHGDVNVGEFPKQSLLSIWNGPVLNAYRRKLLNKDRSLPLCRSCDCHEGAYPHNVDKQIGEVASDQEIESAYQSQISRRGLLPLRKKV